MIKRLKNLILKFRWLLLVGFFVIVYYRVPFIFFIQDEWYSFGLMNRLGFEMVFHKFAATDINHFVPLNSFLSIILYKIFGLNYLGYNLVGLAIHLLNSFLIYLVIKRMIHHRGVAAIGCLVFMSLSVASQLVMWPLVSLNLLTLTFILTAILGYLDYLTSQKNRWWSMGQVMIGVVLALLILEYSLGILLFFPLMLVVNKWKRIDHLDKTFLGFFILMTMVYILIRFSVLSSSSVLSPPPFNLIDWVRVLLVYPLRFVGQVVVTEQLVNFAKFWVDIRPILANEWQVARFNLYMGLMIVCLSFLLLRRLLNNGRVEAQAIMLSLFFLVTSSLPFIILARMSGGFALFAPRYFYVASAGVALLITFVVGSLFRYLNKSHLSFGRKSMVAFGGVSLLLAYVIIGILGNWQIQNDLYQRGLERKYILETISNKYPKLPKKIVFYIESDRPYYGLEEKEKVLPFQSGFGHTLMVWYYPQMKWSGNFFDNRFLWDITSEGYRQIGDEGFGYFRNLDGLKNVYRENHLTPDSIFAYSWNSRTQILTEVSFVVRQEVLVNGF